MTLKEFKESFPDIFVQYESNFYSRKMALDPIDRIINFIESNYNIRLINIVHETKEVYCPLIKFDGNEKRYDLWLHLNASKSFLVGKSLEYISNGLMY